jgi:hypothetical protein
MSLREEVTVTKIETHPAGQIGVYKTESFFKGDELISSRDLIVIYNPGDEITESDPRVSKIAGATWTDELIDQYVKDSKQTIDCGK